MMSWPHIYAVLGLSGKLSRVLVTCTEVECVSNDIGNARNSLGNYAKRKRGATKETGRVGRYATYLQRNMDADLIT